MRTWFGRLSRGIIYNKGLITPPITGDPFSLSLPGQSPLETLAMWSRYLFAQWLVTLAALVSVGVAIYPVAIVIRWLMLVVL